MSVQLTSAVNISFCPLCGKETERESIPVRSMRGKDGELVPTKFNSRVECPEHGEIKVA